MTQKRTTMALFIAPRSRSKVTGMLEIRPKTLAVGRSSLSQEKIVVNRTFTEHTLRFVDSLFLTSNDSLKRCPCGQINFREYTITRQPELDPKRPGYIIINPRKSHDGWCQWPIIKLLFATPSYDTPHGWFLLEPMVSCPDEDCPFGNHEPHIPVDAEGRSRKGVRKFPLIRLLAFPVESLFYWIIRAPKRLRFR